MKYGADKVTLIRRDTMFQIPLNAEYLTKKTSTTKIELTNLLHMYGSVIVILNNFEKVKVDLKLKTKQSHTIWRDSENMVT